MNKTTTSTIKSTKTKPKKNSVRKNKLIPLIKKYSFWINSISVLFGIGGMLYGIASCRYNKTIEVQKEQIELLKITQFPNAKNILEMQKNELEKYADITNDLNNKLFTANELLKNIIIKEFNDGKVYIVLDENNVGYITLPYLLLQGKGKYVIRVGNVIYKYQYYPDELPIVPIKLKKDYNMSNITHADKIISDEDFSKELIKDKKHWKPIENIIDN